MPPLDPELVPFTFASELHDDLNPDRASDWQLNLDEFATTARATLPSDTVRVTIDILDSGVAVQLTRSEGTTEDHIAYARLRAMIDEYLDTIQQLGKSDQFHRVEALDMAKKATHDKAGRVVKSLVEGWPLSLEAARKLFTLILSLLVDTTRLSGVYGHRRLR